ncbi:MAG: methylglutamate dehydrogenase [Steroidobacteraceae bacterium]|jgi:sarcosine oxidase subunit gamma
MTASSLKRRSGRERLGLKGPQAALWLGSQGVAVPAAPNTVLIEEPQDLLIARLGTSEFFVEAAAGPTIARLSRSLAEKPPGVFPVLREDWGFDLAGEDVHAVLAQVCNVNFAALAPTSSPVIMTMMVGVAVLVVPQAAGQGRCCYRIWCDPTFGPYLGEALGAVVVESGGISTGVSA